jgi:indolepyruvate ferredoxin oxidoreductase alpha subunit
LTLDPAARLGIITTGLGLNYYLENAEELDRPVSHLHIGAYPAPVAKVRQLAAAVDRVLLIEEGYPFVERALRGLLPPVLPIAGKESGELPPDGELTPDIVRAALGLPARCGVTLEGLSLPSRPPQLCAGCPHADTFNAVKNALALYQTAVVTSDIGCYTLGALPPYSSVESCVCMGASVGMAKGAAEAGLRPAVGIIGDSTFLHSGVTPLIDAVAAATDMTLIIVDNQAVAMTGGQQTMLPSSGLQKVVLGTGIDPAHFHVLDAHPRQTAQNSDVIAAELAYHGPSVIIAVRECIETAKARKKQTV